MIYFFLFQKLFDKIENDFSIYRYFFIFFSFQFYDLIERNKIAMSNLQLRSLTIFAPTNEAFQKYNGSPVQVQYHMCKYIHNTVT